MTTPSTIDPLDRALRDALLARTRPGPDDARLLATILDVTDGTAQDRPHRWAPAFPRPLVLGLAGLVIATLLVALAAGALLRLPPPLPANGPIVVTGEGERIAIDPVTGSRLPASAVPALRVTGWWDADWSPDGRRLATSDAAGIRIADVDALGPVMATLAAMRCGDPVFCTLDWFPDGRTLAVATGRTIVRVDPATDTLEVIREASGPNHVFGEVAVSPDGRRIAYLVSDPSDGTLTLRTLDLESAAETIIATREATFIPFVGLTWSPAGDALFALTSAPVDTPSDGGDRAAEGNLLTVERIDPVTGTTTATVEVGTCFCIGLAPGFALSPDGTSFVVVGSHAGGTEFWLTLYTVNGGEPDYLTRGVSGMPAWQPIPPD